MPGVPSGRACENCRRRRQKCDYAKPACSRCIQLRVECVGSGERRFLFIDQKCTRRQRTGNKTDSPPSSSPSSSQLSLSPYPSSESDWLSNSFAEMIKPTTDCRFNLALTYGEFVRSVPQRLGSNPALDAAAQALVASHTDFSLRRPVTPQSLTRYSDAIQVLTRSLDDPTESSSLETICAVLILTLCQNLSGLGLQHLNSHCQGAVQMLRARQPGRVVDEFETDLHTYLQGPILVQSLFNRTMRLSPSKFEQLAEILSVIPETVGQSTLALLFQIPALLQHGRAVVQHHADHQEFVADLSAKYQTLRKATSSLYSKFMDVPPPEIKRTGQYGICLAFSCMFNCMLRGLEPENTQLRCEAEELVADTFALSHEAQNHRPLGASHMMLNLTASWVCAKDEQEKRRMQDLLSEFSWDFRRDAHRMWPTHHLENLRCDLQFQTDPDIVLAHTG